MNTMKGMNTGKRENTADTVMRRGMRAAMRTVMRRGLWPLTQARIPALIPALLFFAAGAGVLSAQQAVIREMCGTVELKAANATVWEAARTGQEITLDTIISTGFKSSVLLDLGNSVLIVRPLTRLSIAELSEKQANEKVEIRLQTGRVRADVNPPKGGRTSFTVRSPIATASVRGTVFEFDTQNLTVSEGSVEFAGAGGVPVVVDSGGSSYTTGSGGQAAAPKDTALAELRPELPGSGTAVVVPEVFSPPPVQTVPVAKTPSAPADPATPADPSVPQEPTTPEEPVNPDPTPVDPVIPDSGDVGITVTF